MATTSQNIQMIHFKADGSQTILNPKTLANLISVDRTGNSNIPTAVTNLQTLANSLGSLAFKSAIQPMGGASSGLAGSSGLVPAPTAGSQGKFLRGDGSWASIDQVSYSAFKGATQTTVGVIGLVPAPAAGSQNMFLRGDGTWGNPPKANFPVFSGATTTADGAAGLVTAPKVANRLQFLRGDGTWQTIDTGTIVSASITAAAGASVITNPLSVAISDAAQIYQNGILLTKNTHYTINAAGNIALNGYTAEDGDIFTVVSKSTGTDVALTATGANITLVNTAGYFDSVNNVESAIAKIGAKLNGGVVSGVRVNGTIATPDSNGVVDVASPTIQVNGTTVTPSTTGVVNITNVVKTTGATMTGNLVAKATSTGNHVRNISVYASDATLPTTGNDGDIVLVYSNS